MTDREQLIQQIEAAFADVERGNGLTLHEAAAFEGTDYCTAEERAQVRALDPELRWQDIPDAALDECEDRWSFDEEGFRFHLPAYLRWHLRHSHRLPPGSGLMTFICLRLWGNTDKQRRCVEASFDRFTPAQKRVIARFLECTALQGPDAGSPGPDPGLDVTFASLAAAAWESYWHRFQP